MKRTTVGALGAVLLLISGASVADEEASASILSEDNFSATFGLTTNFMYRGISFSFDENAGYGSFDWAYNGWFAGIYSIALGDQDGDAYDTEIDYYFGYGSNYKGINWSVMPIYYEYISCDATVAGLFFGADRPLTCDFVEVWFQGDYQFEHAPLQPTVHLWYAYTPDFEFESGTGHYLKGDVTLELGAGFALNLGVGHQEIEGGDYSLSFGGTDTTFGWHYVHYEAGITKSWKGFDLDLRYHDTDSSDATDTLRNYIPNPELTDGELVVTISRTF